jgi:hydroxymethylpyrimidine/phosphomethylpyrimidine kinase
MTCLIVIAGSDSSGGAGITRDTAMAATLGVEVKPVITAVTVQTQHSFAASHPVPAQIVAAQIHAALEDQRPDAIKIGMLGHTDIALTVADALHGHSIPIVLDPVLKSSSGGTLFSGTDLAPLIAQTTILTPNLDEAAALTQQPVATCQIDLRRQASLLLDQGASAILIKGGHATGPHSTDHLFWRDSGMELYHPMTQPRLTKGRRGTGCALATLIASRLALGHSPTQSCHHSKDQIFNWIAKID